MMSSHWRWRAVGAGRGQQLGVFGCGLDAANLSSREADSMATVTAELVVAVGPEVVTGSGWDIYYFYLYSTNNVL